MRSSWFSDPEPPNSLFFLSDGALGLYLTAEILRGSVWVYWIVLKIALILQNKKKRKKNRVYRSLQALFIDLLPTFVYVETGFVSFGLGEETWYASNVSNLCATLVPRVIQRKSLQQLMRFHLPTLSPGEEITTQWSAPNRERSVWLIFATLDNDICSDPIYTNKTTTGGISPAY